MRPARMRPISLVGARELIAVFVHGPFRSPLLIPSFGGARNGLHFKFHLMIFHLMISTDGLLAPELKARPFQYPCRALPGVRATLRTKPFLWRKVRCVKPKRRNGVRQTECGPCDAQRRW